MANKETKPVPAYHCKRCGTPTYGFMDGISEKGLADNSPIVCPACIGEVVKALHLVELKHRSGHVVKVYVDKEREGVYLYYDRDRIGMFEGDRNKWLATVRALIRK